MRMSRFLVLLGAALFFAPHQLEAQAGRATTTITITIPQADAELYVDGTQVSSGAV